LKILVFEYITGGGLAGEDLPIALAAEGRMMLQALLDDLKSLAGVELILPLDRRCIDFSLPANTRVVPIGVSDDIWRILPALIADVDMVWPVAPETGGVLENLARQVKTSGKAMLLSDPDAIALCGNKLETYRRLKVYGLPVVETLPLSERSNSSFNTCVIKPIDGVGCEGSRIIDDLSAFQFTINDADAYVLQPFIEGQAISLSCLFKQGRAWLLCCNKQDIVIQDKQFVLRACLVNINHEGHGFYQSLLERVAQALPDLWGYIGIDLIETEEQGPLILEINPRLTTSFVGIKQATGINVTEQSLALLRGEPDLTFSKQQAIKLIIH